MQCARSVKNKGDESVQSSRDQHAALQYIEHHASRLPIVVLARVARESDLYEPVQMAQVEVGEGRPFAASLAGLGFDYALLPFAVAGIAILRRRRIDQWFLLVPAGIVTVVSALFYALVRFRALFEVCLVVLGAPAMVVVSQRLRRHVGVSPSVSAGRAGLLARRSRRGRNRAEAVSSLPANSASASSAKGLGAAPQWVMTVRVRLPFP